VTVADAEKSFYRQKQDRRMVEQVNKLIREAQGEPFTGVGNHPETEVSTFNSGSFYSNIMAGLACH